MTVRLFTPDGLVEGVPFQHVALASGARQVHVAGQTASDASGGFVGEGDLAAQTAQALRNVGLALRGAGASFADVVRFTFYIPDWRTEKHDAFLDGIAAVRAELGIPDPMPPSTLIGVAALYAPENLIEIEATAVIE